MDNLSNDKKKSLQLTLDKLEKSYGKGIVMKLSDDQLSGIDMGGSTTSGELTVQWKLVAQSNGVSEDIGAVGVLVPFIGTTIGDSIDTANLVYLAGLAATDQGFSELVGTCTVEWALASISTSVSITNGTLLVRVIRYQALLSDWPIIRSHLKDAAATKIELNDKPYVRMNLRSIKLEG